MLFGGSGSTATTSWPEPSASPSKGKTPAANPSQEAVLPSPRGPADARAHDESPEGSPPGLALRPSRITLLHKKVEEMSKLWIRLRGEYGKIAAELGVANELRKGAADQNPNTDEDQASEDQASDSKSCEAARVPDSEPSEVATDENATLRLSELATEVASQEMEFVRVQQELLDAKAAAGMVSTMDVEKRRRQLTVQFLTAGHVMYRQKRRKIGADDAGPVRLLDPRGEGFRKPFWPCTPNWTGRQRAKRQWSDLRRQALECYDATGDSHGRVGSSSGAWTWCRVSGMWHSSEEIRKSSLPIS